MGVLPGGLGDARHRHDAHCNHDRRKSQTRLRRCAGLAAGLILAGLAVCADPIRVATFNSELSQKGPGLLLRDVLRESDQVKNVVQTIASHTPDILVLQSFDYDAQNAALLAFRDLLSRSGLNLHYVYAPIPNTGIPTGIDIEGDGRSNAPRDAQGYGRFPGEAGIAILSRFPIIEDSIQTYSEKLWRDAAPNSDLTQLLPKDAWKIQRLSSVAAVAVPIEVEGSRIWLLTHHATPPVFDGLEDRNGFRNADENRFWLRQIKRELPHNPYVLASQMNVDPNRGQGHRRVISDILKSPLFLDPFARWPFQDNHTANYSAPGPGKLRVSYVLPSPDIEVADFGMSPDIPPQKGHSRHRLVWVDINLPP